MPPHAWQHLGVVVVQGLNAATGCVFSLIVSAQTFQYRFRFREEKLHSFTPLSPPAWFLPVNRWDA